MPTTFKVVHYLNQFFGGLGAEEKSRTPVQIKDGPVGPGRALQAAFKGQANVVATIVCGDDYVVEDEAQAAQAMKAAFEKYKPDLVVAGPAFDSGRYGLGCALACRTANAMNIPAVTGMHPDNAAIITYRHDLIAVPTGINVTEMLAAVTKMAALGLKLGRHEELGPALQEGYIPTGRRKLMQLDKLGYERALGMLMARIQGKPWVSEIQVQQYETVPAAPPIKDHSKATIAVVCSTGMVPKGNPDGVPGARALVAERYSVEGLNELKVGEWESAHGGFNTTILNTVNPNYAMPLPALRKLEKMGVIKAVYPFFYTTVGNQTAVNAARDIGRDVAKELKEGHVDGALQVAG